MRTEHEAITEAGTVKAHVGDLLEARAIHGGPARRGEVVEIMGEGVHERYRVRWEEHHESIVFPADGVTLVPQERHVRAGSH